MGLVSTSIKVDEDLWKELKIEAIRRDLEVSQALGEAIRGWLKK